MEFALVCRTGPPGLRATLNGVRAVLRWGMLVAVLGLFSTSARAASAVDPQFRLFLTNGTVVACLGEFARVGDRVVFTLALGDAGASQLMSLPSSRVDWPKTDAYSDNLRAVRYADVRGEQDFSALAGEVAGVLNEIAISKDPARRLQLALQARRRLEAWPRDHYNYRASDVSQIVQLVDEAISEMRAAAGEQKFDLSFVANVEPPPPGPLLPAPTVAESLSTAAAVVDLADDSSERMSLLESLAQAVDSATASLSPAIATHLRALVQGRLQVERRVETAYSQVATKATSDARAYAVKADVRGVERVITRVSKDDARLGRKRPERMSALLTTIREQLDAARRLRLARDQWSVKVGAFRNYQRAIAGSLADLDQMRAPLDDIKRLAGPPTSDLPKLQTKLAATLHALSLVVPPTDLASAHALVESAARLAAQAVGTREAAVRTGAMDRAWQASSAAAGAMMLLTRAKHEIDAAIAPPGPE